MNQFCNYMYFQLRQGTSWYKGIWNSNIKYELNCQWDRANIGNQYSVSIMTEYLLKNRAKDDVCFLECCSLLCWIPVLSIRPSLFAALHFRIASLQYPCNLSVGYMPQYGTRRYIDKDNLPCRLVQLSNCAKILLDQHTRTCYNPTKITFLLKLCFC